MKETDLFAEVTKYCHNNGLFSSAYFESLLRDQERFPKLWQPPENSSTLLQLLITLWSKNRETFVEYDPKSPLLPRFTGLPAGMCPKKTPSESAIENDFVRAIIKDLFGYGQTQNKTLELQGEAAEEAKREGTANKRPDMIIFRNADEAAKVPANTKNGVEFCFAALMILDAKKFQKGIGADELEDCSTPKSKRHGGETGAREDVMQVDRYLRGYRKDWGILTNGRCWRLMHCGETQKHLRFDLVLFLEDILARQNMPSETDLAVFTLFWNLFGLPAVEGGLLDALKNESVANTRMVRDALRENAHEAARTIAEGFWLNRNINTSLPSEPDQPLLDQLRELALTFLYRLLFILKAEAQNLLPMTDDKGGDTLYAKHLSTRAIFEDLRDEGSDRDKLDTGFLKLQRLFGAISKGDAAYQVPAYNGGLFDAARNRDLEALKIKDDVLHRVFSLLIYCKADGSMLENSSTSPSLQAIPYRDLDVRDLGDIYESLLELRLVLERQGSILRFALRNQKGERKSSGSYFTPDRLVEHLVKKTISPLLAACDASAEKVLGLRILDPAMGSGHFLVKAVDVIADYLTRHCDPDVETVPSDNGPKEFAYWKSRVVENCIYGVDYNPMAVELAKVALWLHCARFEKPLSFIDHHLKCGNSLVGTTIDRLSAAALVATAKKGVPHWRALPPQASTITTKPERPTKSQLKKQEESNQQWLPFDIDTNMLSGVIQSIRQILLRPSNTPDDIRSKAKEYADQVSNKLAAHRLLADLWCGQWFCADPGALEDVSVYQSGGLYDAVKACCGIVNDGARFAKLTQIYGGMPNAPTPNTPPFLRRLHEVQSQGYGPRPLRFFHWQLEFPEVAFDETGKLKPGFGFDAVVGNPPWDKIKPAKRDYYGPFDPEVPNAQGTSLDRLIIKLEKDNPQIASGWRVYEKGIKDTVAFLSDSCFYQHQSALVDGAWTGGDPDLFRYFVERADQCLGPKGRLGLLVPGTLWQGDGCTGLRRLLLRERTVESLYVFENYRKWAFAIDSRFKFTAFVARAEKPLTNHTFTSAFMLRDTAVLDGLLPERSIQLSANLIERLSPETLALLDFRSDADAQLMARLHSAHPAMSSEKSGWNMSYRRELDMTNDAWRFKTQGWMERRGFTLVRPVCDSTGKWGREIIEHGFHLTDNRRKELPDGGEYWIAADASYYGESGYEYFEATLHDETASFYIAREDMARIESSGGRLTRDHFRILPNAIYTALYEGRMVHNFDPCQKTYLSGEGRKALWQELPLQQRLLHPKVFVSTKEVVPQLTKRMGFCHVTGATNERSFLGTLVPTTNMCGNSVPTLTPDASEFTYLAVAVLNSFVADAILRLRVSTNLTMNFLSCLAVPDKRSIDRLAPTIREHVARLCCLTPELSDYWNDVFPKNRWTYASASRDLWERASLRAQLDAIVAELYGLSVPEYARILTGFPLLDRDCPPLASDYFATECDETRAKSLLKEDIGITWDQNSAGIWQLKPRSFVTRDFALLTYVERRQAAGDKSAFVPERLDEWFRDEVGIDPTGPLSRFRIGKEKNLRRRVELARESGAIPYVASGSSAVSETENDPTE